MAKAYHESQRGLVCPKCGGHRLPNLYTRHRPETGQVVRVRKCSACGHRIRTREEIISNNAPCRVKKK